MTTSDGRLKPRQAGDAMHTCPRLHVEKHGVACGKTTDADHVYCLRCRCRAEGCQNAWDALYPHLQVQICSTHIDAASKLGIDLRASSREYSEDHYEDHYEGEE